MVFVTRSAKRLENLPVETAAQMDHFIEQRVVLMYELYWVRWVGLLRRIAFLKKKFAHSGRWIKAIQNGVRLIPDKAIADWWKKL